MDDAQIQALVQQALQVPGVRAAVEAEAEKVFLEKYAPWLAVGGVAVLGSLVLAFQAGQSSRG